MLYRASLLPPSLAPLTASSSSLYSGANQFGQMTFTWLATGGHATEFKGDIAPLLDGLTAYQGPTTAHYLGYVAFGSETFYANQNATFYVPKLMIDIETNGN